MNELVPNGEKRMTVREVAEALGMGESTVRRHIKDIRENLANVEQVENGKATYLTEAEVTEIKRRIERSGRNDLTSFEQASRARTELEMREKAAEVMAWLLQDNKELKARNAELEPKAAFFDQVADSKTALPMREAAAALNLPDMGRNTLFQFLRTRGILDARNIPYRQYQDSGYFRVIEQSYTDSYGESHVTLKTLVYQKGLDFIRRLVVDK